jgi:hypothetical protein
MYCHNCEKSFNYVLPLCQICDCSYMRFEEVMARGLHSVLEQGSDKFPALQNTLYMLINLSVSAVHF